MNPLDNLPPDKARHFIGGCIVATVAAAAATVVHLPQYAWQAAIAAALAAGVLKEAFDARANSKATGSWRGVPTGTPHGVEGWDAIATTLGSAPVAFALFMKGITWTS